MASLRKDIQLIKIVVAWKLDDTYRKQNLLLAIQKDIDEVITIEKNLKYFEYKRKEWISEGVDIDALEKEVKYEERRKKEQSEAVGETIEEYKSLQREIG